VRATLHPKASSWVNGSLGGSALAAQCLILAAPGRDKPCLERFAENGPCMAVSRKRSRMSAWT